LARAVVTPLAEKYATNFLPMISFSCLITAAFTIEQYRKRRLIREKHTDCLIFTGEHIFGFREYPVRRVLSVHAARAGTVLQGETLFVPENLVDPKHYYCLPDEGIHEDIPFSLVSRPLFRLSNRCYGRLRRRQRVPEQAVEIRASKAGQ
jgi:hypothetical protein